MKRTEKYETMNKIDRRSRELIVALREAKDGVRELSDGDYLEISCLLNILSNECRKRVNHADDLAKDLKRNNVPLNDIAWSGAMFEVANG